MKDYLTAIVFILVVRHIIARIERLLRELLWFDVDLQTASGSPPGAVGLPLGR